MTALSVAMVLASIGAAVVGGWLAARLAPRTPLLAAAVLGACCLAIGMLLAGSPEGAQATDDPLWYRVALQVIVFPCVMAGGILAVRPRRPR